MLKIDHREEEILKSLVIEHCLLEGVEYEVCQLPVGDFLWDDQICIEHKSTDDFRASMSRINSQCDDIKQYPHHILMIHGKWKFGKQRYGQPFFPKQRNHKLLSIISTINVPYVHVETTDQLVDCIFHIRKLIEDGEKTEFVVRHKHTTNIHNPVLDMYLNIPGVGLKSAEALYAEYPSFMRFLLDYGKGEVKVGRKILPRRSREYLDKLGES